MTKDPKKKAGKKKAPQGWQPKQKLAPVFVDNPYYSRAHDGEGANPIKIKAKRNIRESAIVTLSARKLITKSQEEAADQFRAYYESACGAGAGAFDYTKEPVDGGRAREGLSERQERASAKLEQAKRILGRRAYYIVCKIAGEGCRIQDLASTQRERTTLTDYLKDGLDDLATCWGLSTRRSRREMA
jgi:hypothetical protein